MTASKIANESITCESISGVSGFSEIPGDFRAVILLVDVEEFSYKDASGILDVPVGTVMSRLSRGRRLLRERLGSVAEAYGIGQPAREGKRA